MNIPNGIQHAVWDLIRPYKDYRVFIRDIPGIPGIAKQVIGKWSVDLEGFLRPVIGRDPKLGN